MSEQSDEAQEGRSLAEWVTLAVSIVVVAAFVGAAFVENVTRDEPAGAPITVEVLLEQIEQREGSFYVPFEVSNAGSSPVEDVSLLFELRLRGQLLEESTVLIPFLPSNGVEAGTVVLTTDPARAVLVASVQNFREP
ncbi:MAG: hypothetical protein H0W06_04760 [Chloroflexia bacterium]|nr:hypothetical protein [Chloroflexia bacterium]